MNGFMHDLYSSGLGEDVRVGGSRRRQAAAPGRPEVTGPSFRADLERTRALIGSLGRDVAASTAPSASWRVAWSDFLTRWVTFAEAFPADGDYSGMELAEAAETLTTYADEARRWAASFKVSGGTLTDVPDTAPRAAPSPLERPAKKAWSPWWIVGGLAAILGAVLVVVKKAPETGAEG